jgi:hypothetical protein
VRGELASMRDDYADARVAEWRREQDVATLTQTRVDDMRSQFYLDWNRENPALFKLWKTAWRAAS